MSKIDKRMLISGVILCLLPILVGYYYYDLLPNQIAVHFGANGQPDSFVGKNWGIIGMPLFMAMLFIVLSISLDIKATAKKGAILVKVILPIASIVLQGSLIYYAIDNSFDVAKLTTFTVGIIFMVLGNYLPKKEFWGVYNFNLFGLEKGANEQKVIRIFSRFMFLGGVVIFITALFSTVVSLLCVMIFALIYAFLPFYLAKRYRVE